MFGVICKYPLNVILSICLLLLLTAGIFFNTPYIGAVEAQYFIIALVLFTMNRSFLQRLVFIFFILLFFAVYLLFSDELVFLLFGLITSTAFIVLFNKKESNIFLFFLITTAFLFHLYYIQITDTDIRQHDLSGILYYMRQITKNGINFIDFNPWNMYYLFHQPLHFIINGYIYLLELKLWGTNFIAIEGLQYISLFYTSAATVIVAKILEKLEITGRVFYGAILLFSFNPTLFLLSGYISDDAPVLFWSILFIYLFICWYKTGDLSNLVLAAICFSIGTLTKLSILMLVPAVVFLFSCKLYYAKDKFKMLADISLFITIAVPLSLIWIIRNHILYDMPFYNVPDTSPGGQNFNYLTFYERISNFSQLFSPFIHAPIITEENMWLALIKTELFGEWDLSMTHTFIFIPAFILYIINLVLKIFILVSIALLLVRQKRSFSPLALFFIIIYFTIWFYSFAYALNYPYACSTDYRLFATLMLCDVVILALALKESPKKVSFLFWGSIIYVLLSAFIYSLGI